MTPQVHCSTIRPTFREWETPFFTRELQGEPLQYLPGWTVQCINTECGARGTWMRMDHLRSEFCANCGAPLHRVPPPLGPRMRMRPRSLGTYRPGPRAR